MCSRIALLCLCAVLGFTAELDAQVNRRRPQPGQGNMGQEAQPVQIQGTIEGVARGMIALIDESSQQWRVAVPARAAVKVTGSATADFLRSGLFVEFQADLDERGMIKEKVAELTIVTPSDNRPIGAKPVGGDEGGFGEGVEDGQKPNAKRPPNKRGIPPGAYHIVGRLTVGRGGKYSVQTGHGSAKFELAEEPKISIDVADYTVAAKGDKVSIDGAMMPNRPGQALANKVEIELAEQLTGSKKKPAKPAPKQPPRRGKPKDGLPKPDGGNQ